MCSGVCSSVPHSQWAESARHTSDFNTGTVEVTLWTIRSTEWQIKGVRSVGRPKRRWRDGIVEQQGAVWTRIAKDRERWRTLAEGYFLQWTDTAWNRIKENTREQKKIEENRIQATLPGI